MNKILTIAGSDSGGGAGIQADLKTITMLGAYGASVITAVTAQNTQGVQGVYEVPLAGVAAQLDAVCQDIDFQAAKTGMLFNSAIVELVSAKVQEYGIERLVVDPVMISTSGHYLLQPEAIAAVRDQLLPRAFLVTPNLKETEVLTGLSIQSIADMQRAGQYMQRTLGCANVLVKGGHLEQADEAVDLLCLADGRCLSFREARVASKNTHGTGCTLSAALAVFLGQGLSLDQAVSRAKEYLTKALYYGRADVIGHGYGPVRHNYLLVDRAAALRKG